MQRIITIVVMSYAVLWSTQAGPAMAIPSGSPGVATAIPGRISGVPDARCLASVKAKYSELLGVIPSRVYSLTMGGYLVPTQAGRVHVRYSLTGCAGDKVQLTYQWTNHRFPLVVHFPGASIQKIEIYDNNGSTRLTVIDARRIKKTFALSSAPIYLGGPYPASNSRGEGVALTFPKDKNHTGFLSSVGPAWFGSGIVDGPKGPELHRIIYPND